ncbi:capsule assembly Wzi family protein [Acidobacteria bacterium AB60]|nr:capsule assembly Wzi family protein [Acidobacteria bacterium AB60]
MSFAEPANLPASQTAAVCAPGSLGSPYITVDNWIYPAVLRLYSLGFIDHVFLGMRPWTRASVAQMLEDVGDRLQDADDGPLTDEAKNIYQALQHELAPDLSGPCLRYQGHSRVESLYTVVRGISGTPLRDSYHLGSTVINDYGRPYENGISNYSGASGYATAGPFTFYGRVEFQGAQSADGYSTGVADAMSAIDETAFTPQGSTQLNFNVPQFTIPMGPIGTTTQGRVMEAYVSAQVWRHQVSFGKQDQWLGPAKGASFAYSNNAENIYGFEINRIEPLHVPLLSRITGPFRYEFLVGPMHGHNFIPNDQYASNPSPINTVTPGAPWVHVEKVSFRPTDNLEFGFERTVIWGGKGHVPITLHSFLKSFFSVTAPQPNVKFSRNDPGARFGAFDFSYRLPYMRRWLTLYADGEVHDDVSPIDAPRRASWRPGLYLSHVPGLPKLDARFEVAWTDPPISTSDGGHFMYFESAQKQGYTNAGQIFGDWIGREDKGGQAWLTWHLSGNEWIQVNARNQKAAKDFIRYNGIEYGTTLNDIGVQVVKRIRHDVEVNGSFTVEHFKAPIYLPGQQTVTTTNVQVTWFPRKKVSY